MKGSIKEKLLLFLGGGFLVILGGLLIFDLTRKGVYDERMGLNLAVVGQGGEISLLLLRPEEDIVGWVDIPNNVKIKINNSSASYPISSIWSFGEVEKKPYEIVEKSLGQTMGVIVAKTIRLSSGQQVEDVLGQLLSLGLKTDLSIRDRFLIRGYLSESVKSKKILEYNLPQTVFEKFIEPDGKEFMEFNSTLGLWTKNKFIFEPVLDENADVSVNNISSISGLGMLMARQLESAGVHVIEVKAEPEKIKSKKQCIYSSDKNYELTEQLLEKQLGCVRVAVGSGEIVYGIQLMVND